MPEPLPDPRLRRVMDALDATKEQLRVERIRGAHLARKLALLTKLHTVVAKQRPEQRPA